MAAVGLGLSLKGLTNNAAKTIKMRAGKLPQALF